jgi:hypothetical protein
MPKSIYEYRMTTCIFEYTQNKNSPQRIVIERIDIKIDGRRSISFFVPGVIDVKLKTSKIQ